MKQSKRQLLVGALLLALAACGSEGSVSNGGGNGNGDGGGEQPLARLNVALANTVPSTVTSPYIGLGWFISGTYEIVAGELAVIPTEYVPLTGGLEQVQLSVFQGPPAELLQFHDGVAIAMSGIYAFDDRDGDGSFEAHWYGLEAPDVIFGFSRSDFLVWVELEEGAELPQGLFTNPEAFVPGLMRARVAGCFGPLEIVPMDAPIALTFFDPEVGPESTLPEACFDECVEECRLSLYEACLEFTGGNTDHCDEWLAEDVASCEADCEIFR